MSYATIDDLETRYGRRELVQLTDRAMPPSDEVDQAVAQLALDDATDLIDGYVGAKYRLPLAAPFPPLLVQLCAEIARFKLFADQASEEVRKRYEDAIRTLKGIAKGEVALPIDALPGGSPEPSAREGVVAIESQPQIFTRERMKGF